MRELKTASIVEVQVEYEAVLFGQHTLRVSLVQVFSLRNVSVST